jgi:hypothetical protein
MSTWEGAGEPRQPGRQTVTGCLQPSCPIPGQKYIDATLEFPDYCPKFGPLFIYLFMAVLGLKAKAGSC